MPRVLLVRSHDTADGDARLLAALGVDVVSDPYLCIEPDLNAVESATDILKALQGPRAWAVLTSSWGMRSVAAIVGHNEARSALARAEETGARFAAVGPTTAQSLRDLGVTSVVAPSAPHTALHLLSSLPTDRGHTAVLPRSDIGGTVLRKGLEMRGWHIVDRIVYRTRTVMTPPASADDLSRGVFDALVLRSPSAVDAVLTHAHVPRQTAVYAGGPTTAAAATRRGLRVVGIAQDSTSSGIAALWRETTRHA